MSKFKHLSILFLIVLLSLILSGCIYGRGFNGGYYHHRNYHYNSFNGPYGWNYHGYDHHKNYDRNYYRR